MYIFEMIRQQVLEQYELMLRIVIASILGLGIGFERKNRNKTAGIRTHVIVAFGAALIMIISKYGFADTLSYDPTRIASQIVNGIGFLGAGIIFVRNHTSVSGLTTAAGIWATAGVGMAMGAGMYFIAISSGIFLVVLQEILHRFHVFSREAYRATVKLTMKNKNTIYELENYISGEQVEIDSVKINRSEKEDTRVELELVFLPHQDKVEFLNRLADFPGISSVKG